MPPTTSVRPSGPEFDRDAGVHESLRMALVDLFPALAECEITHRWGGPLGIARDWFPSVGLDDADRAGLGRRLRGRRCVHHQPGRPDPARPHPRPGHRADRACPGWATARGAWEPEPLRYLGINAGLRLAGSADRAEERTGRTTWRSTALERMLGS